MAGCARPSSRGSLPTHLSTCCPPAAAHMLLLTCCCSPPAAAAGFVVEISAATIVVLGSRFALPISTTHCLVGAVSGIGEQRAPLPAPLPACVPTAAAAASAPAFLGHLARLPCPGQLLDPRERLLPPPSLTRLALQPRSPQACWRGTGASTGSSCCASSWDGWPLWWSPG